MLAELEERLAQVLGARLPAPFTGRVFVRGTPADAAQLRVLLGVSRVLPLEEALGHGTRRRRVPGSDEPRRVVPLRARLRLSVLPGGGQGRPELMRAVDALLYQLDHEELVTAGALAGPADPGFLLRRLRLEEGELQEPDEGGTRAELRLEAEGDFWPVGEPGAAGARIGQVWVRGAPLPIAIGPRPLRFAPGGALASLTLRVERSAAFRSLREEDGDLVGEDLPFARLAARLLDPSGRPGAGALEGGDPGADDVRLFALTAGAATLDYRPPAEPGRDLLVVGLDDGENGLGVELARALLVTEATG